MTMTADADAAFEPGSMNEWVRWTRVGKGGQTDWHTIAHDDNITRCCGKHVGPKPERKYTLGRGLHVVCTRIQRPAVMFTLVMRSAWLAPE